MKIGDRIYVRGYIDEIRKDTVIVRNDGGYFGTVPSEVITGELPSAQPELAQDLPNACTDAISRQAAIDAINAYLMLSQISRTMQDSTSLQAVIEHVPAVQPEIIRCKDCRFAALTYDGDCKYCQYLEGEFGLTDAVYFDGNDYCSHAERRTDG